MLTDSILEIGIDDRLRLFAKPAHERFSLIYRMATEVNCDSKGLFLYSPVPRAWSYYTWFKHIVEVVKSECNCKWFCLKRLCLLMFHWI